MIESYGKLLAIANLFRTFEIPSNYCLKPLVVQKYGKVHLPLALNVPATGFFLSR
ncbi:MAG: hypothetical protein ACI89T_000925 [Cognaticolwellia sp.]|jgi:hypothetical protein